jgi:hypothetical protein
MNAVQTLRAQARESGQLASTPQLAVNTEVRGDVQGNDAQGNEVQGARTAIVIQPVDPQIIYVPAYNPSVVWGAPAEGSYPALPYAGSGFGSLFSTIANLAGFLPGFQGLLGLRSWGWALSWLAQALFVNNSFFNDFGFHNSQGGYSNAGYGGSSLWAHNPNHRRGVPYGSGLVASRYGAGRYGGGARQANDGWRSFGSGTRGISAPQPRQPFSPRSSIASRSFQRDNRAGRRTERPGTERPGTDRGNQRTFSSNTRRSNTRSSNTRTPSGNTRTTAQSARTFSQLSRTTARTNAQRNDRGFQPNRRTGTAPSSTPTNSRRSEPPRTAKSSSKLHLPFSKAHMSSRSDSSKHGFSEHAPKQKHFSAPKFKAPKAPKSHGGGGGHASRGHSGSKSHRG